jgi:ketosteroid isomerase-like protein
MAAFYIVPADRRNHCRPIQEEQLSGSEARRRDDRPVILTEAPMFVQFLLTLAFLAGSPAAPTVRLPDDLARAAEDYERAQIEGDRPALDRLLAPHFLLVDSDGARIGREAFIGEWTAPGFDPEPVEVEEHVTMLIGEAALLGGKVTLRGRNNGAPFAVTFRYSDFWQRIDGRWRVVFAQATRVRPAASEETPAPPRPAS